MSAEALLSRLDKVKRTGPGRWQARCPAHDDRGPSLSIRELDDGRLLVFDHAGCGVEEVLKAVGCTFDDLFPPRQPPVEGYRPIRRPFLPADAFAVIQHEVTVAALIACDMQKSKQVSDEDYQRLLVAAGRLNNMEAAYGSR